MTLQDLTTAVLRSCAPFNERERAIIHAAYFALVDGVPASIGRIAERAGCSADVVSATFERWPGLARIDRAGGVRSILGLSISPTPHQLEVGGRTLYTWCAWDSLFIPRVLQSTGRVRSHCPVSGRPVHLLVTPDGPTDPDPADVRVSFILASCDIASRDRDGRGETVGVCCEHTHFLAAEDAAERWRRDHPEGTVLTLAEAAELARLFVDTSLALPIADHGGGVR